MAHLKDIKAHMKGVSTIVLRQSLSITNDM